MSTHAIAIRRPSAGNGKPPQPPEELLPIVFKEGRRRLVPLSATFAAIALLTLLLGLLALPRSYTSSVTILAQQSDIIQPLLEGRAVATGVIDRAGMARQVIYSRKVMADILHTGGWLADTPSAVEQDRLIEQIRSRTVITSPRQDLVQISYSDSDPERSFRITERLGQLFIAESLATKERESREAYEFINSRVRDYHRKLSSAEDKLKDYRTVNADAQPGSVAETAARISSLRSQIEQSQLGLLELRSREESLSSQISGESAVTAVQTREGLYRAQLMELQARLDALLLTYTEQYPDVVRTRHQIADIRRSLQEQETSPATPLAGTGTFSDTQMNPHYQALRTQIAEVRRETAAIRSRIGMLDGLLVEEHNRSRRIAASESALSELTRDYEVNRDLYQDLLRRRENARVSMELDREERGLTFRIQDPAVMPVRPTGLRFMHFAIAGLVLAIALPLGLLLLLVRFDPRVRSPAEIERQLPYPLLTVVPFYKTGRDRRREWLHMAMSAGIVLVVCIAYALTFTLKQLAA